MAKTVTPVFLILKHTMGLRVSDRAQRVGLDESEHGAQAYELSPADQRFIINNRDVTTLGLDVINEMGLPTVKTPNQQ